MSKTYKCMHMYKFEHTYICISFLFIIEQEQFIKIYLSLIELTSLV